jgi:cytochrome c oxidase cbb3-type subunit IV
MDYSLFGSVTTVAMLAVFMGIVAWACSSRRNADFERAAQLPFDGDEQPLCSTDAAAGKKS